MAQTFAVAGLKRFGFQFVTKSDYTFGRISAISATTRGNVIICDHLLKSIVLIDGNGQYLSHITTDQKPWDVCVDNDGIAYVTFPFGDGKVETFYADKLLSIGLLPKSWNSDRPYAISYKKESGTKVMTYLPVIFNGKIFKHTSVTLGSSNGVLTPGYQSKLHLNKNRYYLITDNQNAVYIAREYAFFKEKQIQTQRTISIPTLQEPSDVCSDDKGHVYVAGQYSHDIHRVTEDGDVVDIPLSEQHGIRYPVAICFNKEFTRFYVANDWGKSLLVFDVVFN